MHGIGNDFVVIDAINQIISLTSEQIRFMADRKFGIGFDQLLIVEKATTEHNDFKYRIFNADGSEVGQCGNGARCFAQFIRDKKLSLKNPINVDTISGTLTLYFSDDNLITVNMGIPKHNPAQIPIITEKELLSYQVDINGNQVNFGAVSIGNPHAVIQVKDVNTAPVIELGKILESHPIFPDRANIGFMQVINKHKIKLRVYERGSAETLACGSGACASVVIGIEHHLLDHEVDVELLGGNLKISWAGRGHPVLMTGPATSVYEGRINI